MNENLISDIINYLQQKLEQSDHDQIVRTIEAHLLTSTAGHRVPYETGMMIVDNINTHTHLPSSNWIEVLTILITYDPVSACHLLLPVLKHSQDGIALINSIYQVVPEEDYTKRYYVRLSQLIQTLEEEN